MGYLGGSNGSNGQWYYANDSNELSYKWKQILLFLMFVDQ